MNLSRAPKLNLIIIGPVVLFCYACATHLEHRNAQGSGDPVSGVVEVNVRSLNQEIHDLLDLRDPDSPYRSTLPSPFNRFVSSRVPAQVEFELKSAGSRAHDKQLEAYSHAAPASRQYDVYFFDPLKRYWPSEYYSDGSPVPFTTSFIIRLIPAGESKTKVEILEFSPYVGLAAPTFWVTHADGLPSFVSDIRFVAPTKTERERLLSIIKNLPSAQPQEQGLSDHSQKHLSIC